ncbi:MAG: hypothetical protein IJM02_01785 [Clostridia bacterium]|nr:hypothetical protein [Clostridia bacterium]
MEMFYRILKTLFTGLFLISLSFSEKPAGGDFPAGEVPGPGDEGKYLQIDAPDEGFDIWQPGERNGGYRYGPSMILNTDGSIDVWRAASGPGDIVDLIAYKRLYDGGKKGTNEVIAVKPTSESHDQKWTCDPGVIKFGGYYYIGYTTTANPAGVDNDVCVARSKNPEGPYEKWTGSGWGDEPVPLVEYTDDPSGFGAGEPSFVLMGDTLYIYYSWNEDNSTTRVATADATDENWPATLEFHGECIPAKDGGDSADVKYCDEYGRFVAVFTEKRFSDESYVAVWESFDGINFRQSGFVKNNTAKKLHNCGISGRADGHIGKGDPVYLSYAYGGAGDGDWGNWCTRMHEVKLSLADVPKTDLTAESNSDNITVTRRKQSVIPEITTIKAENQVYTISEPGRVWVLALDTDCDYFPVLSGVKFDGYDESVIKMNGSRMIPVSPGTTRVYISWHGFTGEFTVHVE